MLWSQQLVTDQLLEFMPCIADGGFDPNYLPKLGVDIFRENRWKVVGSVAEFGKKHPPETLGYNTTTHACSPKLLLHLVRNDGKQAAAQRREVLDLYTRYQVAETYLSTVRDT
jgi:hypothetical protein